MSAEPITVEVEALDLVPPEVYVWAVRYGSTGPVHLFGAHPTEAECRATRYILNDSEATHCALLRIAIPLEAMEAIR